MLVDTALNPAKLPAPEVPIETDFETETKAEHADESSYKLETFKVHESEKVNSRRSSSCHSEAQDNKPASEISAQFNANFKSDLDSIVKQQQQQQSSIDESKSSVVKSAFIEQSQPAARKSVSTPQPAPTPPALKQPHQQSSPSPTSKMMMSSLLNESAVTKILYEQLATQNLLSNQNKPPALSSNAPKFNQNELNLPFLIENALSQPMPNTQTPNKNREEQLQLQQQQQRSSPPNHQSQHQFVPPIDARTWQDAYAKYPLPFLAPPQFQQQLNAQKAAQTQQNQPPPPPPPQRHPAQSPSPKIPPKPVQQQQQPIQRNPSPQSAMLASLASNPDPNLLLAYAAQAANGNPAAALEMFMKYENLLQQQQQLAQKQASSTPLSSSSAQLTQNYPKPQQQQPINVNPPQQQQQPQMIPPQPAKTPSVHPNKSKKLLAKEYEQQQQQLQQQQQQQAQQQQNMPNFGQYQPQQASNPYYSAPFDPIKQLSPFLMGLPHNPQQIADLQQQQQIYNNMMQQQQQQQQQKSQNYGAPIDYVSQMMMSSYERQSQQQQQNQSFNNFLTHQAQFNPQQQLQQQQQQMENQAARQRQSDLNEMEQNYGITGFTEFQEQKNVIWTGSFMMKSDIASIAMNFVSGNLEIARDCLTQMSADSRSGPLRILQRMRLEQNQLEGVHRKLLLENEHCILLAVPFGGNVPEQMSQTVTLRNGFINYLLEKRAAGIINVAISNVSSFFVGV